MQFVVKALEQDTQIEAIFLDAVKKTSSIQMSKINTALINTTKVKGLKCLSFHLTGDSKGQRDFLDTLGIPEDSIPHSILKQPGPIQKPSATNDVNERWSKT